ncbi:cupin domain-containing protein [Aurantimonas sp. 22II-16-19i]|uniref:cupin domain-containing protein n=1 Tax=Aurantimonas sp. 22II-16-19i TaxID=1317114 RepID=UPI0009F7E087|nr:cupin domain-containing protein [Aurantimonas sp. 22II-16-19i]ORE90067.1 cupin [Aurantimonas sp. 22II-16-19i]
MSRDPASPRPSPVVRLDELTLVSQTQGDRFAAAMAPIAAPLGAAHLGARLVEVPPGKAAWPFHSHHGNDEMFVVLSGTGTVRFGEARYEVTAGAVVVCPAGGAETAHQMIATGSEPLRYVAISTMREPDVMEYPDSGKITVFAGAAPGGDKAMRRVAASFRAEDAVDYWSGEEE